MSLKKNVVLCVAILMMLFAGCGSSDAQHINDEPTISGLPYIETFSGEEYEKYKCHFSPVESAVFCCNGTQVQIPADDERLVRLLNFLAYSEEHKLSVWLQGYLNKQQISEYVGSNAPVLKVNFACEDTNRTALKDTPQIVICGDSYILINSNGGQNDEKSTRAELYWPYGELAASMSSKGLFSDILVYGNWGNNCWLNILEYAGFYAQ